MRAWIVGTGLGAFFLVVAACTSGDPAAASAGANPTETPTIDAGATAVALADASAALTSAADGAVSSPDSATLDAAPAPTVTFTPGTLVVNGTARTYMLGVPSTYDPARSYPLVMLFHGNPGTIEQMMAGQPFETVSQQDAIVVYLQSTNADGQAAGAFDWDLNATSSNVDIPFVHQLPAELVTNKGLHIDPTRIYGYGYSGGAFFLQSLQCVGADVFHALACNAGGVPNGGGSSCSSCSTNTVPTILIHGQADDVVGPASGEAEARCQAQSSGCATTQTATTPSPCALYDGCRSAVEWCYVPGITHNPPWSASLPTAWAFFTGHGSLISASR